LIAACSGEVAPEKVMAFSRGIRSVAATMASTASSRFERWRVLPVSSMTKTKAAACMVMAARSVGSLLTK
jgi:hypothetical protein